MNPLSKSARLRSTTRRGALQLLSSAAALAADWPQWRGPARDGQTNETGLLRSWPAGGPKQLWVASGLGEGYSSYSIAGGRLFTMGQDRQSQWVEARDAASGKSVWRTKLGGLFEERRGNGPRCTPTLDGDLLFAIGGEGTLVALQRATGQKVWEKNVVKEFGGNVPHWGISESPLIDGNRLIVQPGGRDAGVVALDKATGKTLWKSLSDEAGYSSAIAFNFGGQRHLVVFTAEGAVGLHADTGKQQWRYNKVANGTANIATPLFAQGHVFLSSDYGTGCALLKLSATGGTIKADEVYFSREMKNHYCSSVLVGDHLYGFNSTVLTSLNFLTGNMAWRDRSVGKGQLIAAEGLLYLQGENGTVALAEATPKGYQEISRFSLQTGGYPLWTLPAIANGRLYLRDQDKLYCYDIARK